jgi:hypothetical protein
MAGSTGARSATVGVNARDVVTHSGFHNTAAGGHIYFVCRTVEFDESDLGQNSSPY